MPDQPVPPDQPRPGGYIDDVELLRRFSYHPPTPDQIPRYEAIRAGGLELARLIRDSTPVSREQSLALTALDEVVYHANGAIARRELMFDAALLPTADVPWRNVCTTTWPVDGPHIGGRGFDVHHCALRPQHGGEPHTCHCGAVDGSARTGAARLAEVTRRYDPGPSPAAPRVIQYVEGHTPDVEWANERMTISCECRWSTRDGNAEEAWRRFELHTAEIAAK